MPIQNPGLAIDMNFESLDGLIGNRSLIVIHEVALACPCKIVQTSDGSVGHADPTCKQCLGYGFIYRDPVRMDGMISNMTFVRNYVQLGFIKPGDLSFSPSSLEREVSDFDRIILTVSVISDPEILVRGQSSSILPRPDGLLSNEDLLLWEAAERGALWVEDRDGNIYRPGEYLLAGRRVQWVEGCGPSIGTSYTIKYRAYPEYIAWVTPLMRFDRDRSIGQRVMLRKVVIDPRQVREVQAPWMERIQDNPDRDYPYSYKEAVDKGWSSRPPR